MARVFAKWSNVPRLPEDLHGIHISCGVGDDQSIGFDLNDEGATLTAKYMGDSKWEVTFSALSGGLEDDDGYWLSPYLINDETEATDFGIDHEWQDA